LLLVGSERLGVRSPIGAIPHSLEKLLAGPTRSEELHARHGTGMVGVRNLADLLDDLPAEQINPA